MASSTAAATTGVMPLIDGKLADSVVDALDDDPEATPAHGPVSRAMPRSVDDGPECFSWDKRGKSYAWIGVLTAALCIISLTRVSKVRVMLVEEINMDGVVVYRGETRTVYMEVVDVVKCVFLFFMLLIQTVFLANGPPGHTYAQPLRDGGAAARPLWRVVTDYIAVSATTQPYVCVTLVVVNYQAAHLTGTSGDMALLMYFAMTLSFVVMVEKSRMSTQVERQGVSLTIGTRVYLSIHVVMISTVLLRTIVAAYQKRPQLVALSLSVQVANVVYLMGDCCFKPRTGSFALLMTIVAVLLNVCVTVVLYTY